MVMLSQLSWLKRSLRMMPACRSPAGAAVEGRLSPGTGATPGTVAEERCGSTAETGGAAGCTAGGGGTGRTGGFSSRSVRKMAASITRAKSRYHPAAVSFELRLLHQLEAGALRRRLHLRGRCLRHAAFVPRHHLVAGERQEAGIQAEESLDISGIGQLVEIALLNGDQVAFADLRHARDLVQLQTTRLADALQVLTRRESRPVFCLCLRHVPSLEQVQILPGELPDFGIRSDAENLIEGASCSRQVFKLHLRQRKMVVGVGVGTV